MILTLIFSQKNEKAQKNEFQHFFEPSPVIIFALPFEDVSYALVGGTGISIRIAFTS